MPETRSVTILNVDDYEVARYTTSQILRQAGFQVTEASTGDDALASSRYRSSHLLHDGESCLGLTSKLFCGFS
jgi:CheY-like chemotaxis protein